MNSFEITAEDVYYVLMNHGIELSPVEITELFESLDMESVEQAALLSSDDLDEQTDAAYEEIWNQIGDEATKIWERE